MGRRRVLKSACILEAPVNVRGYVLVKDFIVVEADKGLTVRQANEQRYESIRASKSSNPKQTTGPFHHMVCVPPTLHMLDVLNRFQGKKKHIALVTNQPEVVEEQWNNN